MARQSRNIYQTGNPELDRILNDISARLDVIEGLRPELEAGYYNLDSGKTIDTTTDLDVAGDLSIGGDITVVGDLDVDGIANLDNTDIDGTLDLSGNATFHSNIDVDGIANLDETDIDGTINVQGNATFQANIDVDGIANLDNTDIDGTVDISSTLDIGAGTTRRVAPAGTFVSNANGNPNINDTVLDVDADVTEATWESIGPTGSSATNIWTGLNNVPTDADWLEMKIETYVGGGGAGNHETLYVYVRATGSSEAAGTDNLVYRKLVYMESAGMEAAGMSSFKVAPDSSRRFDLYWSSSFTSTTINLVLVGWGFNP